MKKSADVVIIGGGMIGCATAYLLSRHQKNVVLLERKGIATEASGANYGMIWIQTRQPGYDITAAKRSLELYPGLVSEVFDIDIEFEQKGGMTVFFTELEREVAEAVLLSKQEQEIPIQLLDKNETKELEPALSDEVVGSFYCPIDAQLNPMLTTIALARAAQREGATIYTETEVHSIKLNRQTVSGVVTNRGEIKTEVVVNAAGSWGSQIGQMVGLKIPVYPNKLQSLVTEQTPRLFNRVIMGTQIPEDATFEEAMKGFSYTRDISEGQISLETPTTKGTLTDNSMMFIKPTISGNTVCGTVFEFAGHDRSTSYEGLNLIASMAAKAIPALRGVQCIRAWANFDPYTIDGVPIEGETEIKGFILAVGHGTAMSQGLAVGESLTAFIVDGKPMPFTKQTSIERFRSYALR